NGFNVRRIRVDVTDNPTDTRPNTRRMNPVAGAIQTFRSGSPLTFDQLSWPTEEQLSGSGQSVYASSAQLFVSQLLHLKRGPQAFQAMLTKLPDYLNWQLAFLDAFHAHFQNALDVEKWWALEMVQFTGRDLLHLWNHEES